MAKGQKKIPMRMCVGCRTMFPKKELMRIVRTEEGGAKLDPTGKAPGRGAYICKNSACLERAVKVRAIENALEVKLPAEEIQAMKTELDAIG